MNKPINNQGTQEQEPGENNNVLWLLVLTPIILSAALTIAAFAFGPSFDPALLMADGSLLESLHVQHGGGEAASEDVARCIEGAGEVPSWEGSTASGALVSEEMGVEDRGCVIGVWSSRLRVGEAASDGARILGYEPSISPPIGELADTDFTYWRRNYNVDGLSYQESPSESGELVLNLDQVLPFGMLLRVGAERFPLPYANDPAGSGNYVWQLDSDPGWKEGRDLSVALFHSPLLRSVHGPVW